MKTCSRRQPEYGSAPSHGLGIMTNIAQTHTARLGAEKDGSEQFKQTSLVSPAKLTRPVAETINLAPQRASRGRGSISAASEPSYGSSGAAANLRPFSHHSRCRSRRSSTRCVCPSFINNNIASRSGASAPLSHSLARSLAVALAAIINVSLRPPAR